MNAADAALTGTPNRAVDENPLAREYRFFVGTVLTHGVPGSRRAAFEEEVSRLPPGPFRAADIAAMLISFRGVSEAYSPEQWERAFASRDTEAAMAFLGVPDEWRPPLIAATHRLQSRLQTDSPAV